MDAEKVRGEVTVTLEAIGRIRARLVAEVDAQLELACNAEAERDWSKLRNLGRETLVVEELVAHLDDRAAALESMAAARCRVGAPPSDLSTILGRALAGQIEPPQVVA